MTATACGSCGAKSFWRSGGRWGRPCRAQSLYCAASRRSSMRFTYCALPGYCALRSTARGKRLVKPVQGRRPYRCQFSLKRSHVKNSKSGSYYVLAARCGGAWRFLIFKTYILHRQITNRLGTRMPKGRHMLTVIFFERRKAKSSTRLNAINLSRYAGAWDTWPVLQGGLNLI